MQRRDIFRYSAYFSDSSNHDLSLNQMAIAARALIGNTCFVLHQQNEIPDFLRSLQRNKNVLNARFQYVFMDNDQVGGHWCAADVRIANNQLEFYIFDSHYGLSLVAHMDQVVACCPGAKITASNFFIQDSKNCAYFALCHAFIFSTTPNLHEELKKLEPQRSRFDRCMANKPGRENIKLLFEFLPKAFGALFENDMDRSHTHSKGKGYLRQDGTLLDDYFVGKDTNLDVANKHGNEKNTAIYLQKENIKKLTVSFIKTLSLEDFNSIIANRDGLDYIEKLRGNTSESKSSTQNPTTPVPSTTPTNILTAGMYGSHSSQTTVTSTQMEAQPQAAASEKTDNSALSAMLVTMHL